MVSDNAAMCIDVDSIHHLFKVLRCTGCATFRAANKPEAPRCVSSDVMSKCVPNSSAVEK
jgi:hypothetical protein